MNNVDAREQEAKPLRLLFVSNHAEDYTLLRKQLDRAGGSNFELEHAWPGQAAARLLGQDYDLVLTAAPENETGSVVVQRPGVAGRRRVTSSVTVNDEAAGPEMQREIQSAGCNHARGCEIVNSCASLVILGAVERYCKEKRSKQSDEILQQLRHTVEQSPDMVVITNRAGCIEYVNPAFERLTGYTSKEVCGETLGILKSEQQVGELFEEMWGIVLSGRIFHGEMAERKKNGESMVVEKTIAPFIDGEGNISHFISTAIDLTERRRLESEMRQVQKLDAIGRLAGGVAHDFNNLLMVINAYAELMLDSLAGESPLRENVSEIMMASRKAGELTRQLLAFGRKQPQLLQVLDLNAVVAEIGRMVPRLLGEDIRLTLRLGDNLSKVKADRTQIDQIVMNLAANARDAMPDGGKLTIETSNVVLDETFRNRHSMIEGGEYVMLAVTDSGHGIAEEHLPHIFEPFYTTKGTGKGTGLGLATVYGIVKQHKGNIWVYTEPGMGTSFKIYLPRVEGAKESFPVQRAAERPSRGCETLFLVEDEAAVREPSREFLTRQGYTILEASNGAEALRLAREYPEPIHMMITDVVMPDMGGLKLAQQMAAERPEMRVLFVSGYGEGTVMPHGEIGGGGHFLQKPFALMTLAAKVREILDAEAYCSAAAAGGAA